MIKAISVSCIFIFLCLDLAGQKQNTSSNCNKLIDIAKSQIDEDEYAEAKKTIISIAKLQNELDPQCEIDFQLLRGNLNLNEGNARLAQIFFQDAIKICKKYNLPDDMVEASYLLALSYIDDSKKKEAAATLDKILSSKETLIQSEVLYEVLETRAMLYSTEGAHDKAMQALKEAIVYMEKNKKAPDLQIQLLNQVATNYQSLGMIDSSIHYYTKLISLKTQINDESGLLSDYSTLGGLYKEIGNYKAAQTAYIETIKYGEALNDSLTLITVYNDIARVYLAQRLIDPALDYAEKAANLSKIKNAFLSEGRSYHIKAEIFDAVKKVDRAILYYDKALEVYKKLGHKQSIADVQLRLAALFGNEKNLEEAELALREALLIRMDTKDKTGELNTKLALCEVSLKLDKNLSEVSSWLEDCLKIAKLTSNKSSLQETYRLKGNHLEKKGSHQQALSHYKMYTSLRDSILNQENAKIVRDLEKKYETAEKDKAIAQQEVEIGQQKIALKKRSTQIVQLMVGLLVLGILGFLIIITFQRNKVFNEQKLSVIEKEKETQVLRAMVSGEEQERRRVARDLHDGLGATMATVKMRVTALQNHLPEIINLESYQKAEELIDDACNSIREISHDMMPGSLNKYGLEVALQDMCDAIQNSNKIEVSFIPYGLDKIMDDVVEVNIFRIVQELLKNTMKHAEAKEVIVQLSLDEDNLNIIVEDDGKGMDLNNLKTDDGIGLGSIRSRVIYLDGKMDIDSQAGKGTTININIPIITNEKQKLWSK